MNCKRVLKMSLQNNRSAVVDSGANLYVARQRRARKYPEPPALALDEDGVILNLSELGEELLGCSCSDLSGRHISRLFPELSGISLVQQGRLNPSLNYVCHCGKVFHAQNLQGGTFFSRLYFVCLANEDGQPRLRLIVRPLDDAESDSAH
jgi:hypothetical protein